MKIKELKTYVAKMVDLLNTDDIDHDAARNIQEKAILNIMEHTLPRIKIIVSNVVEDEKDAGGLWDLATELRAIIEPSRVYTGDELQQQIRVL